MKPVHVLVLCLAVTSCQCGTEQVPNPITLRLRNDTSQAIFVDATGGRQGLSVQRRQDQAWSTFVEELGCDCQSCERHCDSACFCPAAAPQAPRVLKVPPGATVERVWTGFVQTLEEVSACGIAPGQSDTCLEADVPPLDETLRLQLCYALAVPGLGPTDGSAPVPGLFPVDSQVCVHQEFITADGEVEIRPPPPSPCSQDTECTAPALCLQQVCTTTCPAHDFRPMGGAWQVRVLEPEEQGVPGFFSRGTGAGGRRLLAGTGTLTSVRYSNGTMTLQLSRAAAPSGEYKATIALSLPPEAAVPLQVGESLAVHVVDASTSAIPENRALALREAGGALLLAADPGQLGAVLGSEETSPFTVSSLPGAVGCEDTPCGKRAFHRTEFRGGTTAVALEPGESEEVVASSATWNVINLSNSSYGSTSCALASQMPYVLVNRRVAQGP
ncbi:MAG: hypothetical protein JXB05_36525 [Myxococcaceae bacterium]|nr:hypothetical protein [Myxococcaceae bacterium]